MYIYVYVIYIYVYVYIIYIHIYYVVSPFSNSVYYCIELSSGIYGLSHSSYIFTCVCFV